MPTPLISEGVLVQVEITVSRKNAWGAGTESSSGASRPCHEGHGLTRRGCGGEGGRGIMAFEEKADTEKRHDEHA